MSKIRKAAVSGSFYSSDPEELKNSIFQWFSEAKKSPFSHPKAIIAPHAGHICSGPIAASAYAALRPIGAELTRVVLMGPAHYYPVSGIAIPESEVFATPLGEVSVDQESLSALPSLFPWVEYLDEAHAPEHSLEVQLPFLQLALPQFSIVPLLIGSATRPADIATVFGHLFGGRETLIVVSSDLSHYLSYLKARETDQHTAQAILALDASEIGFEDACGQTAIQGLLLLAAQKHLKSALIDLRNSGDISGEKRQVVGYGAFHFA